MRVMLSGILSAACIVAVVQTAQAQNTKAAKNAPSGAHVAISLGDGRTIESKGKGSPGSVQAPNNSSSSITFNYNPKELTVKKPAGATRKK